MSVCKYTKEGSERSIGQMLEEIKLRSIFNTQLSYLGRRRQRNGGADGQDVKKERERKSKSSDYFFSFELI